MNGSEKYDSKRLLFRRQFVLGPHFIDDLPGWKKIKVGKSICLTVHPDLNTYQGVSEQKSITLLGYVLDPNNPDAKDSDIINSLIFTLQNCESIHYFFNHTTEFGGRWILIVDDGEQIALFNDPMGLRQVFYTNIPPAKEIWCATQPGIIADILQFEMDPVAINEYMNKDCYQKWDECLWPGDSSPYSEIKHLLPNHYLDLNTGLCYRYWPDKDIAKMSLDESVERISERLRGLMMSAANRFDLALGMTAGWDTRLILAACKNIKDQIYYFTLMRKDIRSWNEADAIVAPRLLSKLGLTDNIVPCPDKMDEDFGKLYKKNVSTAHELWGAITQGLYKHYPQNRVCITGNSGEITRVRFRLAESRGITAKDLASFNLISNAQLSHELADNTFALKAWERWLSGTGHLYNIHVLDLFYWEHWAGNFSAAAQAERDIVQEAFTPYNCRKLLTDMLSVDEKYRNHEHPTLYRELVMNLWPDALKEPVNPVYTKKSMKSTLKNVLVKTHLDRFVPEGIQRLARKL